jgi:hypothetical protein
MKRCILRAPALALGLCVLFMPMQKLNAQSEQAAKKFAQLVKQLKLTPQQKLQVIPILEAEAPRVEAIKADLSLSKMQKVEQLKAVHDQTDRSILTPEQYQKLQEIRQKEVEEAIKKKRNQ